MVVKTRRGVQEESQNGSVGVGISDKATGESGKWKRNRLDELLREDRLSISTLSEPEFSKKSIEQQRFIIILEQIAFKWNTESQRQLASRLGIASPNLQGWLRGDISQPHTIRKEDLEKIARARGIRLSSLVSMLMGRSVYFRL